MTSKQSLDQISFSKRLVLANYFLNLFGVKSISSFGEVFNDEFYEGFDNNGNTNYYSHILKLAHGKKDFKLNLDKLKLYDDNIVEYVNKIGMKRGGLTLKYFQYISVLFTEIYLDKYFNNKVEFLEELNDFLLKEEMNKYVSLFDEKDLKKLAFMSATGSGKTLIMHMNILQYMRYFAIAKRKNSRNTLNKIILISPNESMSQQHFEELQLSSIKASIFERTLFNSSNNLNKVLIIDINKFKEESNTKTIAVDSFESNNLVLVDEGHRGLKGDVWYEYRNKLASEGFTFEYSATFKQALNSNNKKDNDLILNEYSKSIIIDYSYKYFHGDGYGKEYKIFNLNNDDSEMKTLYLTGCLLTFYQQLKVMQTHRLEIKDFNIEKPLMVFVGNRVTGTTSKSEVTDIEEALLFIDNFVKNKKQSIVNLNRILNEDTGLVDGSNNELFFNEFQALVEISDSYIDGESLYTDILKLIFNTNSVTEVPRLHLENIKSVKGEIALKIGDYGEYFGLINVSGVNGLLKSCETKGIIINIDEFNRHSLFQTINHRNSNINILIGSRKFNEGWNSKRVSVMGLINFAKSEGSQAIQLFGRGVRLTGYNNCLKRSSYLDFEKTPRYLYILETLVIFGIKANYMEDFKSFLEVEEMSVNEKTVTFDLPVISKYSELVKEPLHIIKVKKDIDFKMNSRRIVVEMDNSILEYLISNKVIIDCRSKVQSIISDQGRLIIESNIDEQAISRDIIRYLDIDGIFEELIKYKNTKKYFNLILVKDKIKEILENTEWYVLIVPKHVLNIDSIEKLMKLNEFILLVLKNFIDKFFKYKKQEWELPYLEYQELLESDKNFIDNYKISYTTSVKNDIYVDEIRNFITNLNEDLKIDNDNSVSPMKPHKSGLLALNIKNHLYTPLIHLKNRGLNIQVSPVSLNESEIKFIEQLDKFLSDNSILFKEMKISLLRNKSKVGMGFFEAGNFYPDFVLWINKGNKQYINFIDPKGLLMVSPDDPKIKFGKNIKNLESRLKNENIIVNSFILSITPYNILKKMWNISYEEMKENNIIFLDEIDCISNIFKSIDSNVSVEI